jgi:transcriptional regulator EpsA
MDVENGGPSTPARSALREPLAAAPVASRAVGGFMRLDALDLESLLLNLDLSKGVRARHQFFGWTQGPLQSLIEHEVLICALRPRRPSPIYVDSFSTIPIDTARMNEALRGADSPLLPIIKGWERNHCEPLVWHPGDDDASARSAAVRSLTQIGVTQIVAHGTHDAGGEWTSLFAFARHPGAIAPKWLYLVELAVPFLHSAWVRSLARRPTARAGAKAAPIGTLTARQQEIVRWIYRGKNNAEIALILDVSPLTVKNHVQRILRKLNVTNRAQAVGKALALGILNL